MTFAPTGHGFRCGLDEGMTVAQSIRHGRPGWKHVDVVASALGATAHVLGQGIPIDVPAAIGDGTDDSDRVFNARRGVKRGCGLLGQRHGDEERKKHGGPDIYGQAW